MVDGLGGDYPLIAIAGPTATGKSELALYLAERLGGEVINYDSVQCYRGFNIGAGKLEPDERRGIPHHLIDLLNPVEAFTAGDFRQAAFGVLKGIQERGNLPILAGGTGLYLRALLLGLFEGPPRSEELRARLRQMAARHGRKFVHQLLKRLDPDSADRIDPRDLQKAIRAVEVCVLSREAISTMQARGRVPLLGYRCFKVGLNPDRSELYARINRRVERMFASGLEEETRRMLAQPDAGKFKALGALGYRQVAAALRSEGTMEEALRNTQIATRHYAKRQITWFRREPEMNWFAGFADDPEVQRQVLEAIEAWIASKLTRAFCLRKVVSS